MGGNMINFIKKMVYIVKNYDNDFKHLTSRVNQAEKVIRDRTDIHADIHYKSKNQIIAVGRYRNRDYVQVYNISTDDFNYLIKILREMEMYGRRGRIDSAHSMKAIFEHEFI